MYFVGVFPKESGLSLPGNSERCFEETGIGFEIRKPIRSNKYVFGMKTRVWSRRWSGVVQWLPATNPEGDSKLDVVGIVHSVPFEPGTDLYGRMLSEHRQMDDEHSKGYVLKR